VTFLSPWGAWVAVAVVVPLAAFALLEARARRVSGRIGLTPPPLEKRLGIPIAICVVAAFLAIAAAQPVISGSRSHSGRSDAQVFVLFDVSRSMLARGSARAPDRLQRAKQLALQLRHGVPDVPFGVASLTDRVLPHLFPTLDMNVFESVLRDAVGIERPPPSGTNDLATDFSTVGDTATNNYFGSDVGKRLLVFFSDGESDYFDDNVLHQDFEKGNVHVLFVHLWNADEKIYLSKNHVDAGYRPDPQSNQEAQRFAAAGGGDVVGSDPGLLISQAKAFLGTGPHATIREQRTRISLGPYVALMALLPLGFVLLRRNV
jgi:hypothetical protein